MLKTQTQKSSWAFELQIGALMFYMNLDMHIFEVLGVQIVPLLFSKQFIKVCILEVI